MTQNSPSSEEVIAAMMARRGFLPESLRTLATRDPALASAYDQFVDAARDYSVEAAIDPVTRELVLCGMLLGAGQVEGLRTHLREFYRLGGKEDAAWAMVKLAGVSLGAPAFLRAVSISQEVWQDFQNS